MVQKSHDIFSGFFLLLISIGMFAVTFSFKALTVSQVGPDFMPRIIAIFIGLVSIAIIVNGFKGVKKEKRLREDKGGITEKLDRWEEKTYAPVIKTVALMVGYLALMPYIGFLIMTAVYLFLQMHVLSDKSNKRPIVFILVSIISAAVTYYVFRSIFYVMLPSGILG